MTNTSGCSPFFNDTYEAKSWVYSDEQTETIQSVRGKIETLEQEIKSQRPNWQSELAEWEATQKSATTNWTIWDTDIQEWEGGLNHPEELADHSILILGHPSTGGVAKIEGETQFDMVTGMRFEALLHKDLPFSGPGRSYWGTFAISEWEVSRKWHNETDGLASSWKTPPAISISNRANCTNIFKKITMNGASDLLGS